MIAINPFRAPAPRRPAAAPAPKPAARVAPAGPDRFERRAPSREDMVAQLREADAALTWHAAPAEKLRLLAGMAKLRTDGAADALMQAYTDAASAGLPTVRAAALARTFQTLLTPGPGGLSAAKREEAIAFVLARFRPAATTGDVQQQLGYALAISGSEAGADALIAHYRRSPATGAEGVHRPLGMLAFCPHPKVSAFLASEHARLSDIEAARMQVLATLLEQLDRLAN